MNAVKVPRRWKAVLVNFSVVFPSLQGITRFIAPWLSDLPGLAREGLMVLLMCLVLSYGIPKMTRALGDWMYR